MRMRVGDSAGLTLIELLAAMLILLVGVYSVAALFPKLSRNIGEEGRRTGMSRSVEAMAAAFQSGTYPVPAAISPRGAYLGTDPDSRPTDPDTTEYWIEDPDNSGEYLPANSPNSRDDFVWVYGEEFTVPAPTWAGGYPCYVPRMGLIDRPISDTDTVVRVVELRELREAYHDPGPTGSLRRGEYYLRPDGQFRFNASSGWWREGSGEVQMPGTSEGWVEYDWFDGSLVQRVPWEYRVSGAIVQAVAERGGTVVPGHTRARARWGWYQPGPPDNTGIPSETTLPNNPTQLRYVVDRRAGQALYFPPYAVGRTLRVDYRIRTHGNDVVPPEEPRLRRAPIMWEDLTLPSTSPFQIQLTFGGLDDENPVMETDYHGTPLTTPESVLIVDLADGRPIVSAAQSGDPTWDYLRGITAVDFPRGLITLDPVALSGRLGRPVRIYYRTMDQHMITVQRVPAEFVEAADGIASAVERSGHRTYRVGAAQPVGSGYVALYRFPAYCEGHTVQVDYTAGQGILPVRVSNEMHVIGHLGSGYGFGFVLSEPHVKSILSVRGTSLRVSGWWRTESGRVSRLDVTTMVFPWAS